MKQALNSATSNVYNAKEIGLARVTDRLDLG